MVVQTAVDDLLFGLREVQVQGPDRRVAGRSDHVALKDHFGDGWRLLELGWAVAFALGLGHVFFGLCDLLHGCEVDFVLTTILE